MTREHQQPGPCPVGRRAERALRATGFVSAVLLVVLLATTGLPGDSRRFVGEQQVATCEVTGPRAAFRTAEPAALAMGGGVATHAVAAVRALPRTRRVDTRGLPPPRAPTA